MNTYFTRSVPGVCALLVILGLPVGVSRAQDSAAKAFRDLCAQKAAAGDSMGLAGIDDWLFLRSELRHMGVGAFWGEAAVKVSRASAPEKADPLPAIMDFNEQLKKLGIELILAPVPCKALIYPEKLGGPIQGRLDAVHQAFYQELRGKGVRVLDVTDMFLMEKARAGSPALYCKTDSHWSPYACEVMARALKQELGGPAWLQAKPAVLTTRQEQRPITGDLTDGKGKEILPTRVVQAESLEDKASPIVLLGDSHTLVFHMGVEELHGAGAGLADQLAAELGVAVDVLGVRGSGATPARINLSRRAKADPAYLSGKRLLIWCFAAREFTESGGWSMVKLSK